jgi:chlorobactene glucosyltransferase
MTMDYRADMLTIFPTQLTVSWAERLTVPLMNFAILAYLLELLVRKLPAISLAAANGQVLLFQKEIYRELGGHKRVRAEIIEDVKLARQVKGLGYRLVIGLGHGMIKARMYTGWNSVREGFGKNILAGYGNQPIFLLLSTLFHLLIFVYPWLAMIGAMIPAPDLDMLVRAGVAVAMGIGVRAIAAVISRAILIDALWMPASVISMTLIALQGLRWHFSRSGPHWKGRSLRHVDNPSGGLE